MVTQALERQTELVVDMAEHGFGNTDDLARAGDYNG